jgi:RNA polymerase sigma-70 factor, ECF subfamily
MTESVVPAEITLLLRAWGEGDRDALDRLMPFVYEELRRAAHRQMRGERAGITLQASALVNEVYLRMAEISGNSWQNRAHFFAAAASMMRRILLDAARSRAAKKRGGGELRVTFEDDRVPGGAGQQPALLISIDDALQRLAGQDARKARVVELRFFGGLTEEEMSSVLNVSIQSVKRDWKIARAWLLKELNGAPSHES